jgi:hypothetical protein
VNLCHPFGTRDRIMGEIVELIAARESSATPA